MNLVSVVIWEKLRNWCWFEVFVLPWFWFFAVLPLPAVSLSFDDTVASHFPILTQHVVSFRLFGSSRMLRSWNQVRITALILERSRMCNSFLFHDLPSEITLDIFPESESSWEQFQAHIMCILLFMSCYFWKINCPVCMYKRLIFNLGNLFLRSHQIPSVCNIFILFSCAAIVGCDIAEVTWCTRVPSQLLVRYCSCYFLGDWSFLKTGARIVSFSTMEIV